MEEKRDFSTRLKDLGIELYNAAKKEYDAVLDNAEKQIKKDKLKKRFNLENPYRFAMVNDNTKLKFLDSILARHAKRYDEDDILVFFGNKEENDFQPKQRIRDLSDDSIYEIIEIVDVVLPVKYENQSIEVPCTAIYGKVL